MFKRINFFLGPGILRENKQSSPAGTYFTNFLYLLLGLLLAVVPQVTVAASASSGMNEATLRPSAMTTLSRRSAKPGDHLKIVVTLRGATHPLVLIPSNLPGLRFEVLRRAKLLSVDGESVWLFRYLVTPAQSGEYEISPLRGVDGGRDFETKPLFLHVSPKGELPTLSAQELSVGVNIPVALSAEVLKAAPQPTPKPTRFQRLCNARHFIELARAQGILELSWKIALKINAPQR